MPDPRKVRWSKLRVGVVGTVAFIILFALVFVLVYLPVIQLEEQHLRRLFPEYADYAKEVPALWPRWTAGTRTGAAFRWALYWKNEEYQAAIGLAVGAAYLWWRM